MGREVDGIIIRPPIEKISSGKVFRPDRRLIYKLYFTIISAALGLYAIVMLGWIGIGYIVIILDEGLAMQQFIDVIATYLLPATFWFWVIMAFWMIPAALLIPAYVRSIEYSVISESGDAMPEIYVKKGIINITRKHVPFRTITNISSRAGPFDRIFGIGNVEIETAGYSGTSQMGPEEKLEGIVFYEELRDFILQELRKIRTPYSTATEPVMVQEAPVPNMADSLQDEILIVLREIRDLLKTIAT
ncbi:MAG: PH domain-containing protein [Candidatus Thorarchaeota archaeon]